MTSGTGDWLVSAAELKRYEAVLPGFAARLLNMAEAEQRHEHRTVRLGQVLAAVVALAFLGASTFLISAGHEVSGAVLGTVDLVALVTVFVSVNSSERRANSRKFDPIESAPVGSR